MKKDSINRIESYLAEEIEIFGKDIHFDNSELESIITNEDAEIKTIENIKDDSGFKGFEEKNKRDLFTKHPEWEDSKSLNELYDKIHNCLECQLGNTRTSFVYGNGNPNADILIIGEAPGKDEDIQGKPFVGRAGQLLTKILEAINLTREEVYIANIIKCRPPENRRPLPEEIDKCEPYLKKQIELIKPAFILALGLTAADTLLKQKNKMSEIRGNIVEYYGTKMIVTYHPAALLRNSNLKKFTWEDIKLLRQLYDSYKSSS